MKNEKCLLNMAALSTRISIDHCFNTTSMTPRSDWRKH